MDNNQEKQQAREFHELREQVIHKIIKLIIDELDIEGPDKKLSTVYATGVLEEAIKWLKHRQDMYPVSDAYDRIVLLYGDGS